MKKVLLLSLLLGLGLLSCGSGEDDAAPAVQRDPGVPPTPGAISQNSLQETIFVSSAETQPSSSRLKFERMDLDLGELYQQTEVPVSFPFEVDGPDPITVSYLKASCGCTDIGLSVDGKEWPLNTPIPSGSKGAIDGLFTSASYQNVKASTITIRGNGLGLPVVLNLKAFIRKHFELSPASVRFGQISALSLKTSPYKKRVKILSSEPMEIKSWKRLPLGIEVDVVDETEITEDGRHVSWIDVLVTDKHGAGMVSQSLLAKTSMGRDLEIHINGNIVGPVRYAPEEFMKFGAVNQGTPVRRVVKILATSPDVPLPTPKIEFLGPEYFAWKVQEKEPGREWVVRFSLSSETPIGRHGGKLKISFPGSSEISNHEVKVSAMVRKAP